MPGCVVVLSDSSVLRGWLEDFASKAVESARVNVMAGDAKLNRSNKSDADLFPFVASARALVSPPASATPRAPALPATVRTTL